MQNAWACTYTHRHTCVHHAHSTRQRATCSRLTDLHQCHGLVPNRQGGLLSFKRGGSPQKKRSVQFFFEMVCCSSQTHNPKWETEGKWEEIGKIRSNVSQKNPDFPPRYVMEVWVWWPRAVGHFRFQNIGQLAPSPATDDCCQPRENKNH